ncbi:MAG TPA: hypothetical protein VI521_03200 [Candidatus Babeliales bacterium]|nr:hypothetical protein [Candidatus Babeliales bacterium]
MIRYNLLIASMITVCSTIHAMHTNQECTVYDLIPRSISLHGEALDSSKAFDSSTAFRECLKACYINNRLLEQNIPLTREAIEQLQPDAQQYIDALSEQEFVQKRDDWMLQRNWYERRMIHSHSGQ